MNDNVVFPLLCISFVECKLPANTTMSPPVSATNGSSGGEGAAFCVPNGNAAIKFLGFKEVSIICCYAELNLNLYFIVSFVFSYVSI